MAQHRLGEIDQAQATLQTALDFANKTAPPPSAGKPLGVGWSDWVRMDTLRRKAVAVLGSVPESTGGSKLPAGNQTGSPQPAGQR
jgi:hypothetical protein